MSKKKTPKPTLTIPPRYKKRLLISAVVVVALLAGMAIALASITLTYKNKIYPKTYIGTINFGGKSLEQAKAIVNDRATRIPNDSIIRVDGTTQATLSLKEASLAYDVSASVANLYAVGRTGTLSKNIQELFRAVFSKNKIEARYSLDDSRFSTVINQVLDQTNTEAKNATVVLQDDGTPTISPSAVGHGITKQELTSALSTSLATFDYSVDIKSNTLHPTVVDSQAIYAVEQTKALLRRAPFTLEASPAKVTVDGPKLFSWLVYELKPVSDIPELATPTPSISPSTQAFIPHARAGDFSTALVAQVDPVRVKDYLVSFSNSVNKDPVNAVLGAKDGKVVVIKAHQDGKTIKLDESTASIVAFVMNPSASPEGALTLPTDTVLAEIQESTIEKLGLKELIGRGETRFVGSPENRVHNITTGANFLNGAVLPKDHEFSTIKTLGKIDGTSGYLPELVIKGDRTIPEFGGGLCQVSTTLFRATLNAGLPITARTNHSYRVSYYEPPVGLDATIFQNPDVDFKFKNDTPGYILIQSRVEGKKITFELYGTKDGRVSTISDPIVTDITSPPPEIRTETDTLPKGEVKQIEKPHDGATAIVNYSVTRDGKEIYKKTFRSRYVPWTARFLVGTKEG